MTDLQADVDAIQELLKLAKYAYISVEFPAVMRKAVPAIERLLGIVSGVEKLQQRWRDEADMCETLNVPFATKREQTFIASRSRDCADELKALLDREK